MKAFEKWLNRKRPTQEHKWEMVNFEWGSKFGWRAALEWFQSQQNRHTRDEVDDIINKELEEE